MLTRTGRTLLFGGFALLTTGLALGNPFYATLALVPLCVVLAALAIDAPHGVKATMRVSKGAPRQGDELLVEVDYEVAHGAGAVEVHVPLPEAFKLVHGRNVHVVGKPLSKKVSGSFSFTVNAGKRGEHEIGPVRAERMHALAVRAPATDDAAPAVRLQVRPAHALVKRMPGLAGLAKQMFPENDAAVAGIRTTEFRDIREYTSGDSIKWVNWRASARLPGFLEGTKAPLVNEYEHEGKKSVWLFLDAAPYMQVGTSVEDSFEHAIKAATGMAAMYLDRGYKLGAYIYNHDKSAFLYPEVGGRQLLRWQRLVTGLKPGADDSEGLYNAIERAHRFLLQDKPLVLIVTRAGRADERAFQAMKKLRGLTGRRRRRMPVLIVSPIVHAAIPIPFEYGRDIVQLMRRRERPVVQRLRRTGVRVVEWDPTGAPLAAVLMQSARVRAGGASS